MMDSILGTNNSVAKRNKMSLNCKENDDVEKIEKLFENKLEKSNRSATDKYWCVLFIVVFASWILSLLHVFLHRTDYKVDPKNSTAIKNDPGHSYFFGKNWILDAIFCNVAFLSEHHENSGSIVIWANVLICSFLIIYTLLSMRTDGMFNQQLEMVMCGLLLQAIVYRVLVYFAKDFDLDDASVIAFHEKLKFWIMPEVTVAIILYTKRSHEVNSTGDTRDELPIEHSDNWLSVLVALLYTSAFFIILPTILSIQELDWGRALPYVIIGSAWYIILTMFYFALMMISCSDDLAMSECDITIESLEDDDWNLRDHFWRSFKIIGRYHFGTACYHATLIFPRVETLLVSINDPEVKQLPVFTNFTDRIYLTQWKLHNLSLVTTAVYGSSHSESIKHLSRVFNNNLPKLEYFQGFSQATRSVLALLISTNSLILITLWAYGLDDRQLSLASWEFYVGAMFIVNVMLKLIDVSSDTMTFYMDQIEINYPQKRWVYVDDCLIK